MASKSKTKGKAGEREVSKIFNSVFGGSWQRVFGSGAFVGGKNSIRMQTLSNGQIKATKADIIPPDEMDIVIEVKKGYSDFPFHQVCQQKEIRYIEEWLDEVYTCLDNEFWLLCMGITRRGWYVLVDPELGNFKVENHSVYFSPKQNKKYILTSPLDSFLITNKEEIIRLCRI